jgi:hypothetical protein
VAARAKPTDQSFPFRAPRDGEYWFAVSTVARRVAAATNHQPQMQVIVDTAPPRLEFTAHRGGAGEVVARWQALDPNLDPASLTIDYQASPEGAWEPLAVAAPAEAFRQTYSGESSWWPQSGGTAAIVRARVRDRAGNPTVVQATLAAAAGSTDTATVARPEEHPVAPRPSAPAVAEGSGASRDPFVRRAWPAMQAPAPAAAPEVAGTTWRGAAAGEALPVVTYPPGRTPAQPAGRTLRTEVPVPLDLSQVPAGQSLRMVGSTKFELDYEVQGAGTAGIAKVEVWGTNDGGRSWRSLGVDDDNRTPVSIQVEGEGVYGMAIVFLTGHGFGGQAPRPGDAPELWIGVDLTPPQAQLLGVEPGRDVGELVVRWEAADGHFGPQPISLFYSLQPGGPWQPIVGGLENAGSFTWRIDNRVPEQFYLRLEARDAAGNLGSFETPQPVGMERLRPQGRILGVRPAPAANP